MTVTTELKCGFGVIFDRNTLVCMEDGARKLFALLDLCHHDYKASAYAQLSATLEEGETLATLKVCDIYEILGGDNYARTLATILKEVIKEQEGLDLTVSDDFHDSDNVVLAVEDEKMPKGLEVNDFKIRVTKVFRQYMGMLWASVPYPYYVSWAAAVPAQAEPKEMFVDTPLGKIRVQIKGGQNDYPGVYVDLVTESGEEVYLACVEYCESENAIAVDAYHDANDVDCIERIIVSNVPGTELARAKKLIQDFFLREYGNLKDWDPNCDLSCIPLMSTDYEEDDYSVTVYADLVNFAINTDVTPFGGEPVRVSSYKYDTLQNLIDEQLEFLDFGSYTSIDPNEWVKFHQDEGARKWLAEKFPIGSRILIPNHGDGDHQRGEITQQTKDGHFLVKLDDGKETVLMFGYDEFGIDGTIFKGKEGAA